MSVFSAIPAGGFRRLGVQDAADHAGHLLRLDAEGRQRRFHHGVSDDFIHAHVRGILSAPDAAVVGWYDRGRLRGVAEIARCGDHMAEAAFSLEAAYRGRGIGHRLYARALELGAGLGAQQMRVDTTAENRPMVRILLKAGARLVREGAEISGLAPCPAQDAARDPLMHALKEEFDGLDLALASTHAAFMAGASFASLMRELSLPLGMAPARSN